jgi:hypothetical protein
MAWDNVTNLCGWFAAKLANLSTRVASNGSEIMAFARPWTGALSFLKTFRILIAAGVEASRATRSQIGSSIPSRRAIHSVDSAVASSSFNLRSSFRLFERSKINRSFLPADRGEENHSFGAVCLAGASSN